MGNQGQRPGPKGASSRHGKGQQRRNVGQRDRRLATSTVLTRIAEFAKSIVTKCVQRDQKNKKRGTRWTPVEVGELKTLARRKVRAARIAKRLKRTEGATLQKLSA